MLRGNACSRVIWMRQVRRSRSATKARANSIASTGDSLASPQFAISGPCETAKSWRSLPLNAELLGCHGAIRARSVVQVHPGPPFKSPVNTRRFSLFPFSGISLTKPFCQPFVNFTIGWMAVHSGALRPFGRRQNSSHRFGYVENAPLSGRKTCKAVQDTASLRKEREGIFSLRKARFSAKWAQELQ